MFRARGAVGRREVARPRWAEIALLSAVSVLLGVAVQAAEELGFERLGPEHGLAHNTANAIIQDRSGFIWIATDDGLDRYDGYEFRHYRLQPAAGSSNIFMEVLEDSVGDLWIGSRSALLRFSPADERFEHVDLGRPASDGQGEITALAQDGGGRLWVARGDQLFLGEALGEPFRFVARVGRGQGPLTEMILEIEPGRSGEIWLLLGDPAYRTTAVARLGSEGGELERIELDGEQALGRAFHLDERGRIWLSAARGASPVAVAQHLPEAIPFSVGVQVVAEADSGVVWLGTTGDGLYRMERGDPASLEQYRLGSTWQENYVLDLLVDRAGSVWASTLAGVWRHDPGARPFRHLGVETEEQPGLVAPAVSAIRQAGDGDVWIGTFGGGLARLDLPTGAVRVYRHDPSDPGSLCDDSIWALHVDRARRLWVGGGEALCVLEPDRERFEPVAVPHHWERPLDFRVLGGIGASILVGFSLHGLFALEPDSRQFRPLLRTDSQLTSLEVVGPTDVWVGYHTGLLVHLDSRTGRYETIELHDAAGRRLSHLSIYDIEGAPDGSLWLATAGGLARYEPQSERLDYPIASETFPGTVCFSVRLDRFGSLWVGTNQGLARLDPAALDEGTGSVFDLADGLGNIEFNRGATFQSESGLIFFGGMTGLTMFRPEEVRPNPVPPPVALTGLSVLGREGERAIVPRGLDHLILTPDDRAVSFEFAALNFIASEKNRYAYRLDGLDPDWVEAGRRRFARYAGIPPGDYVFRVRGSNNHGVWSEKPIALALTVLPSFWQTVWFRMLVVAAVALVLYVAYRMRIRRFRELEQMRLGIASDLHDELSGELSAIALSSAIARRRDYLEAPERHRLAEIESTAREVIDGLRDLVWAINPEHDSLSATVTRMRATASQLLDGLEWSFEEEWTSGDDGLSMKVRRDLYLILKEALTNVVRHADAGCVAVRLERRQQRLELTVEDDGGGFEPATVEAGSGLESMRRRAERIGGELVVESSPGEGATIRLGIPLARLDDGGENSGWWRRRRRT